MQKIMSRYKKASVLCVVDRLVLGVINAINGMMQGMAGLFEEFRVCRVSSL